MRSPCAATNLLQGYLAVTALVAAVLAVQVPPERQHWALFSPFPAEKLLLDVRALQLRQQAGELLPAEQGCTSLDGPRCVEGKKQKLLSAFPLRPDSGSAIKLGGGKKIEFKFIEKSIAPGQTVAEVMKQVEEEEAERASLRAESAALLEGKTVEEARKLGEKARHEYLDPSGEGVEEVIKAEDVNELAAAIADEFRSYLRSDEHAGANLLKSIEEALIAAVKQGRREGTASREGEEEGKEEEDETASVKEGVNKEQGEEEEEEEEEAGVEVKEEQRKEEDDDEEGGYYEDDE